MSETETQEEGVLRTFVLEDPEGSARALREWAENAWLEVGNIVEPSNNPEPLITSYGNGAQTLAGSHLSIKRADQGWQFRKRVMLDGFGTAVHVRIADGVLYLNNIASTTLCVDRYVWPHDRERLEHVAPLAQLSAVESLSLRGFSSLQDIQALSGLETLEVLNLAGCKMLVDVGPLAGLHALRTLFLSGCSNLRDMGPLASLHALQTLHLRHCSSLMDLSPLAGLHALQTLDLYGCSGITDAGPLAGLHALQTLTLTQCRNLKDVGPLAGLHALQTLDLRACSNVMDLSPLASLRALQTLDLYGCSGITDAGPLAGLHALQTLKFTACSNLKDVGPLTGLHALQTLDLRGCSLLTDVHPLAGLHALQNLDLSGCAMLTDMGPLSKLHSLQSLRLRACPLFQNASPLAGLHGLLELDLSYCTALADANPLSGLHSLRTLVLQHCSNLTRIAPLRTCHSLTSLDLSDSGNIRDLDTLSELPNLRELTWTETAAPHAVLAASAVLRGDADFVQASASDWLTSVPLSKAPDTFGLRLVRAFALGNDAPWAADALTRLANALRERARDDEDPQVITPATWAAWAESTVVLQDDALRTALEAALTGLRPTREILPVLTPVLTALADLGGPSAQRQAPAWLVPWVREVLAALVAQEEPARQAAPAAAVFFAGFGLDTEVRAWLDRGTRAEAPHWRDRVVTALLAREVRRDDLAGARRWFAELVTDEARDAARATLAGAFAARLPAEAAAELEAIGDDALRGRVARQLGTEPALLATPAGLYALVLALQDDAEALGRTLVALVEAHPESALVTALARDLAPEVHAAPGATDPLPEVLAHPAWKDEIAGRKWEAFAGRLPSARALLAEAVAARAVAEGLLEAEVREEVLVRLG